MVRSEGGNEWLITSAAGDVQCLHGAASKCHTNHLVCGSDESLQLYDVNEGKLKKTIFVKRYGVGLVRGTLDASSYTRTRISVHPQVRFTHSPNAVLCASNNSFDDAIRYLSLYDNKYLRYFKGLMTKSLKVPCVLDGYACSMALCLSRSPRASRVDGNLPHKRHLSIR